jgi:hypothetical protein
MISFVENAIMLQVFAITMEYVDLFLNICFDTLRPEF